MRLTLLTDLVTTSFLLLLCFLTLSLTVDVVVSGKQGLGIDEATGDGVDKKAVLTRPMNQGIYQFQDDGFVRKLAFC